MTSQQAKVLYAQNEIDESLGHYAKWNTQNTNTVWFHLYKVPKVVKFIETESSIVVNRL